MSMPAENVLLEFFLKTIPHLSGKLVVPKIIVGSGESPSEILSEVISAALHSGKLVFPKIPIGSGENIFEILKAILSAAFSNKQIDSIDLDSFPRDKVLQEGIRSDEFYQFLAEIVLKYSFCTNGLLGSVKSQLGLERNTFEIVENARMVSELRQYSYYGGDIHLNSFCKYPVQLAALKASLAACWSSSCFKLVVNVSTLGLAESEQLSGFFSDIAARGGLVQDIEILFSKVESEYKKIIELVDQIKTSSIKKLTLTGNLGALPIEQLKTVLLSILKTSCVRELCLNKVGLEQLKDAELLELAQCFKEGSKLSSLDLGGNELKTRVYQAFSKFIEHLVGLPKLEKLSFGYDEQIERWSAGWDPEYRRNFAGLVMRLLPKIYESLFRFGSSPIAGLISKQEECDYICQFMLENPQKTDRLLSWMKDFSSEQRFKLAKAYVKARGSEAGGLECFHLTSEEVFELVQDVSRVELKAFIDSIPTESGILRIPKIILKPGEELCDILKTILSAAFNNKKIDSISTFNLQDNKAFQEIINSDVLNKLIIDIVKKTEYSDSLRRLLESVRDNFRLKDFEIIENEVVVSGLRSGFCGDFYVGLFCKYPAQLTALEGVFSALDAEKLYFSSGRVVINVSELGSEELERLSGFFNRVVFPKTFSSLEISFGKVESEYKTIMELVAQTKSKAIRNLKLIGNLQALSFEQLKPFLQSILKASWVESLSFPQNGLSHLKDSELLELAECFKESNQLVSLDLSKNGFEKRSAVMLLAFVEHIIRLPKLTKISLWDNNDFVLALDPKERYNFAALTMRLLSKTMGSLPRGKSPISGWVSEQEESDYFCAFMKQNPEKWYEILGWATEFSDEQQFILVKTYLETGGSINNLRYFNFSDKAWHRILKICIEIIPVHSGDLVFPRVVTEAEENGFDIFTKILSTALSNSKITSIDLSCCSKDEVLKARVNSEEFYQFLVDKIKQSKDPYRKMENLLENINEHLKLSEDKFEMLKNEITILGLKKPSRAPVPYYSTEIFLNSFCKYPVQLAALKKAISAFDTQYGYSHHTLQVDITELSSVELEQLSDFLSGSFPMGPFGNLNILFGKIEGEHKKIIEFFEKIKTSSMDSLSFRGNLKTLSFEQLKVLLLAVLKTSWVHVLSLSYIGLEQLQDSELLELAEYFKESNQLSFLSLSGNNIKKRNYQTLSALADLLLCVPRLRTLVLWHDGEPWPDALNIEDRHKFAEIVRRLLPKLDHWSLVSPFSGIASKQEECEYLCRFMRENPERNSSILNLVESFSDGERLMLAETYLETRGYLRNLKLFNLTRENHVKFFVLFGARSLEDNLYNFGKYEKSFGENFEPLYNIDIFGSEFVGRDLIDAWKTIGELPNEDDDVFDHEALKKNIIEKLIPALSRASQELWLGTNFYRACFTQITDTRKKVVTSDSVSVYRWAQLLQWYTWFMSSLATLKVDKLDNLSPILKEIASYADPKMRYKLSEALFRILENKQGQELLFKLTQKRGSFYLPEIFLSEILLQDGFQERSTVDEEEQKERKERSEQSEEQVQLPRHFLISGAVEIGTEKEVKVLKEGKRYEEDKEIKEGMEIRFSGSRRFQNPRKNPMGNERMPEAQLLILVDCIQSSLSNKYDNGHYMRSFVSALQALSTSKALSSKQKLLLISNLLKPNPERLIFEKSIQDFFKSLKGKKVNSKVLQKDLIKLLDRCSEKEKVLFEFNERYFKEDRTLTAREVNAISRGVISKVSQFERNREFRDQMSNWYLIEGLSLLNEVAILAETPPSQYRQSIYKIFQKIFKLEDEHMRFYQGSFAVHRNEAAILTYLGKIRSLKNQEDRNKLEEIFLNFIRSVLTENQRAFYQERYNTKSHRHLEVVFGKKDHLRALWTQNQTLRFNEFIKDRNIAYKPFNLDYVKFLMNKIYLNNHLEPVNYPNLKHYLDNVGDKKHQLEIKTKFEEALEKIKSTPKVEGSELAKTELRILVQLTLIQLLEITQSEESKAAKESEQSLIVSKIKCINTVLNHLRRLSEGYEFQNDLRMLIKNITSTRDPLDLRRSQGWAITFTDHYWDMLMSGTDVEGSCQRIDGDPELNRCLLSYIRDGKIKMIAVKDETGRILSRQIIRLLWDEAAGSPILYLEEVYPSLLASEQIQAMEQFAKLLAEDLGIGLVSNTPTEESVKYANQLVSLSGVGPEYVDAIHRQAEDGVFTIPHSQVLTLPKAREASLVSVLYFSWQVESDRLLDNSEKVKERTRQIASGERKIQIEGESSFVPPLVLPHGFVEEEALEREKKTAVERLMPLLFSQSPQRSALASNVMKGEEALMSTVGNQIPICRIKSKL